MNCSNCGGSKNLSIKNRYKDGRVRTMLCRACRNKQYANSAVPKLDEGTLTEEMLVWRQKAHDAITRISRRAREGAWS